MIYRCATDGAPFKFDVFFLLFHETGRHNLTGKSTIPYVGVFPIGWRLNTPMGDGRTVLPVCFLGTPAAIGWPRVKFHTRYVSASPQYVDGTCSNFIVQS